MNLASPELAAEFILLYGPGMHQPDLWRVEGEPLGGAWLARDRDLAQWQA